MTWTRLGLRVHPGAAGADARSFVAQVAELAVAAEGAGYDAFWLPAAATVPVADASVLDPFVLAAALVPRTASIRLGCLDHPVAARAPAMLAKSVTSLDVLSGGRAAAGVDGAGDADAVIETLRIVRSMLTADAPTFDGHHFRIREAWNEPRRRDGAPPLVLHVGTGAVAAELLEAGEELVDGWVVAGAGGARRLAGTGAGAPVIALLGAGAGLAAAGRDCFAAGCEAFIVDVVAGPEATGVAEDAAETLLPLLRD